MHFGENQLSRSLIGLSPLRTGHPPGFQPWWVRASTRSYPRFTLPMRRSPRFGSTARDWNALFRLAFTTAPPHRVNLATHHDSQAHSSKGTQSLHAPREREAALLRLAGTRFQVLFHDPSPGHFSPFPHGTSALSVTREYSGLPGGPGRFTRNSTGSVLLGNTLGRRDSVAYGTLTPCGQPFQAVRLPPRFLTPRQHGSTGRTAPRPRTRNACRLSHAHGLASSPFAHHYSGNRGCFLFLRVLRCFTSPRYHHPPYTFRRGRHPMTSAGFPHSETPGSQLGCQLPGAYRRLRRPSSAPDAKASTVCPHKLDTTQKTEDARVHCAVLKQQAEPPAPRPARTGRQEAAPKKQAHRACPLRTQQRAPGPARPGQASAPHHEPPARQDHPAGTPGAP
jgi:hypothetical protein